MAMVPPPTFGKLLRHHRAAARLTQEQLAERAGISTRAISDLERGVYQTPHRATVELLTDALDLSPEAGVQFQIAAYERAAMRADILVETGVQPSNLPQPVTHFVGRQPEVRAIADLLRHGTVPLLTLTGPGGVGKSRVAIEVARDLLDHFHNGVFFIPLAPVTDAALLLPTIARVLGVIDGHGRQVEDRLQARLHNQNLLLVLDNFEHLMAAAPEVSTLREMSSGLTILVTSRTMLNLSGNRHYAIPPMSVPESIEPMLPDTLERFDATALFIERARTSSPTLSITPKNASTVARICARVDGLPLAIELAAARTAVLPLESLLDRLSHRLDTLSRGPRDAPLRQQTMRGTIDWSYRLLSDSQRVLLDNLGVFAGGAALDAIESICGAEDGRKIDVLDDISSLVENSLVRVVEGVGARPRFVMLQTIRDYALEQLIARGEIEDARRRYALHFLALAEQAAAESERDYAAVSRSLLEEEHDNIRAALQWAIGNLSIRDADPDQTIFHYLQVAEAAQHLHAHEEAVQLFTKALGFLAERPKGAQRDRHELSVQTSLAASLVAMWSYGSDEVMAAYVRAQTLCERLGQTSTPAILRGQAIAFGTRGQILEAHKLGMELLNATQREPAPVLLVEAHYVLGVMSFWMGHFELARDHLGRALESYDPQEYWLHRTVNAWDPGPVCTVRSAHVLWYLGYPDAARETLHHGLALAEKLHHPLTTAYALNWAAWLANDMRDLSATSNYARTLLALSQDKHMGFWKWMGVMFLGRIQAWNGDYEVGIDRICEGIAAYKASGDYIHVPYALGLLADAYRYAGRIDESLAAVSEGLTLAEQTHEHFWDAEFRRVQGELLLAGRFTTIQAEADFRTALTIARKQGAKVLELRAAISLSRLWQGQGRIQEARALVADVYAQFREGFDTPDLQEARAFLEELGPRIVAQSGANL